MKKIVFKCNDIKIGINSNNNDLILDLIKKYGDYFEMCNDDTEYNISYLVYENSIPLGEKFKEIKEDEYNYIASKDNNLYVFMKKYDKEKEDFTKRVFTNYYIKILQKSGFVIIHGACVSKNNNAIIISGDKRCGKTTTLLNLLNYGYDFVANDRLAIKKSGDEVIVQGIPFSMGIILEDALNYRGFDIKDKKIETDNEKKKVYIEGSDINKMFNVEVHSSAILKTIIMPQYNPNLEVLNKFNISNPVEALGSNIMNENALPEDKQFMHELVPTKKVNPYFINFIPTYLIKQSSNTTDELNEFIKNDILNNKEYKYDF